MSWKLGAGATTAGLLVFAWGLASGSGPARVAARVSAWPRSSTQSGGSYAVQLIHVDGALEQVLAHAHVACSSKTSDASRDLGDEPLDTDESGYLSFSEPGALAPRTCVTPNGSVSFEADAPPIGQESIAAAARARTTGVGLLGPAPEVFFEDPELPIGADSLAWLSIAPARAQDLKLDPEPGLSARLVGPCEDGFVLELRPSYHVTGLHLEWGPLTARERLDVITPISRGGPALRVSSDSNGVQYAHMSGPDGEALGSGWMGLFDDHGLISSVAASGAPWPLPRLGRDERAVLVGTRGSFFDSATSRIRVQASSDPCQRARALAHPWPAPQPALLLDDGVTRTRAAAGQRMARNKRMASFGLAGGLLGLAAALLSVRRPAAPRLDEDAPEAASSTATLGRALAALAIATTLFGVLAALLYAS